MTHSRRDVLVGACGAAVGSAAGLSAAPAQAYAPQAGRQAPGFYRYKVGAVEITAVTDGQVSFPLGDKFVTNVPKADVSKALEEAHLAPDQITIVFTPIVVNTGSKLVVIDTGYGPGNLEKTNGASGQFHNNLGAAGIDRGAVDAVVISHFHADHINGLLTADGKPAFANAEILVPAKEWAFWMDDGAMSRAPEQQKAGFANVRRVFDALGRKVAQYDGARDVVPGITPIQTNGHTPGHVSYTIASADAALLVTSDLTNRPELFLRHPGWYAMFDMDPKMAEAARRKSFDMAVAEKMLVQGFHYPFPAAGYVEKEGDGYRLTPAPWKGTL
ncbi:MAG: MBL fold metallo-hydrolase [Hyphomicrobiales bacterium]|nr:MBL fold metallo-hydrolase [Hyphomicrobiales bacterium]